MLQDDLAVQPVVRVPMLPPDGGAAWRALYDGPTPEVEPAEDDVADVEGSEEPWTARAAEVLDHAPRAVVMAD